MLVGPFTYWGIIPYELGTPSIWRFFFHYRFWRCSICGWSVTFLRSNRLSFQDSKSTLIASWCKWGASGDKGRWGHHSQFQQIQPVGSAMFRRGFPKMGGTPNSSIFNRIFPEMNHQAMRVPPFLQSPIEMAISTVCRCTLTMASTALTWWKMAKFSGLWFQRCLCSIISG